jgi:hypothetical protein
LNRTWSILGALAASALLAACVPVGTTYFPDPLLPPYYGGVTLSAGSDHAVQLVAGGEVNAATLGAPCHGYIAGAPDYSINVRTSGGRGIGIGATSATSQVVLVIYSPDGYWYCDDDAGTGVLPILASDNALPGPYLVWVGTFRPGVYADAVLGVIWSEGAPATARSAPAAPAPAPQLQQRMMLNP